MTDDAAIDAEVRAIRAEYAEEAAEAEALENTQSVLSVRVPTQLAESLRERAATERIPTSALVRRLLMNGMHARTDPVLAVEPVEDIARRVVRETTDH
jgi:hypothetical protein